MGDQTQQMNTKGQIGIIGLGYVGLPLAVLAAQKGYSVRGYDVSEKTTKAIENGTPLVDDVDGSVVTGLIESGLLQVSTNSDQLREATIYIICVPTPVSHEYEPDISYVEKASVTVGKLLKTGDLVILESTVNPGVSEKIVLPKLIEHSGLVASKDFSLAHCPERINPGDPKWSVANINRVVGALDEQGLQKSVAFYESIVDGAIKPMRNLKEAEAVKVVENTFRDVNIAFVNELAMSFSQLGIDVVNVIDGAATKPFAFMPHYPGCGVGGHCIPVDPYYLIEYARQNGFEHTFLRESRRVNNSMPQFTVSLLEKALQEQTQQLKGAQVAVLGLAYKPGISDCRESPAFEIIEALESGGARVTSFDPYVLERSTAKTLTDALQSVRAVIVATAHKEFLELSPQSLKEQGIEIVIDGRNCLSKEIFEEADIVYYGIGR